MAPVLIVFALSGLRTYFVVFLTLSFVTDALDGPIARAWNLRSKLGSRLDSIADISTYIAALIGMFQFEGQALAPHTPILYAYIGVLCLATLVPLIKYREIASFHLYSSKINALLLAIFIIYSLIFTLNVHFYYVVLGYGMLAFIEIIAVTLVLKEPANDCKGLYWVLRERQSAGSPTLRPPRR
jgi:CDP-diacylglycerol--glycerol-3-phosphate 3-phosphatidyltransferase